MNKISFVIVCHKFLKLAAIQFRMCERQFLSRVKAHQASDWSNDIRSRYRKHVTKLRLR